MAKIGNVSKDPQSFANNICQYFLNNTGYLLSVSERAIQLQPNPVHKIATNYKICHLMKFNRNVSNDEICPLEMKGISFS